MLAEERWHTIVSMIQQNNVVSVPELSRLLNTSEVTIRRDLRELEETGKLRRTRGGAVKTDLYAGTYFEPQYAQLESMNIELKEEICRRAYSLIMDNTAIIMDSSSTTMQLCKYIKQKPKKGLMVVTNCVRVVLEFASSDVETLLVGGQVRKNLLSCTGPISELALKQLKVDKAFIGINGIDFSEDVLTTPNMSEGAIKRSMMACARETIILADHTKFDKTYLSKVTNASEVDLIITDSKVDLQTVNDARECGAELLISS